MLFLAGDDDPALESPAEITRAGEPMGSVKISTVASGFGETDANNDNGVHFPKGDPNIYTN